MQACVMHICTTCACKMHIFTMCARVCCKVLVLVVIGCSSDAWKGGVCQQYDQDPNVYSYFDRQSQKSKERGPPKLTSKMAYATGYGK